MNRKENGKEPSSGLAVRFEQGQRLRVMIQQKKSTADSTARQQVTAFIFLESTRATTYQHSSCFLRKVKFFADATNLLRFEQSLASSLQKIEHTIGNLHIVTSMDAFIGFIAIPAGHVKSKALVFICKSHGAHTSRHRCPSFRT